jgi:hypothetical protein
VGYAGGAAAPTWSGSAACGTCHGAPPPSGGAVWHSGSHPGGNDCSLCHPDASGTGTGATITDATLHVDGKVDLAPHWATTCFGCH